MGSVIGEKRHLEKGDCSILTPAPNYKRRKVSAAREFPHGCGPNALPIGIPSKAVEGGTKKETDISEVKSIGFPKAATVCGSSNGVQALEAFGLEKSGKVVYSLLPNSVNTLVEVQAIETRSMSEGEECDTTKDLVGGSVQLQSLPHYPIPCNLVGRERKCPPRKRVSAVRSFPGGCGPNVPKPLQDEEKHAVEVGKNDNVNETAVVDQIGGKLHADNVLKDEIQAAVSGNSDNPPEKLSDSYKVSSDQMIVHKPLLGSSSEIMWRDDRLREETEQAVYDGNNENGDINSLPDKINKDLIVYGMDNNKKKSIGVSGKNTELIVASSAVVGKGKEIIVDGLMCAACCPWREGKEPVKISQSRNRRKLHGYAAEKKQKISTDKGKDLDHLAGNSLMIVPYVQQMEPDKTSRPLVVIDEEDSFENDEPDSFRVLPSKHYCDVVLPPSHTGSSSEKGIRSKVRDTLRLFHACVRKLLQEEAKLKDHEKSSKRVDLLAAGFLRDHGKYVNTIKLIGAVPGVEIGDIFSYRTELAIIGLHCPLQSGIDSTKLDKRPIAISIVASGGYDNDVDSSDVLIYTGQGGNQTGPDKRPEDQKLERGNLALKNSIDCKTPVRVIRGFKETKPADNADGKPKIVSTYTYDGLYTVENYWQDVGSHGKLVYKFRLRRNPGQRELAWKEMKSKKFKVREGLCVIDISEGKENFPICAVNTVDYEKPPPFTYITSMMYPDWCRPIPPKGCDCKKGCSDSNHCACAVKNGGEIPYNTSGAIVEAKALVYECGPSCKCPPSCYNRVSQHGIKLPLEIFKTDSMGWGVRCLSSIPSGSFICEYIGELLDDKEAEQRIGSDEYLFDIGQNYSDHVNSDERSALMPDMPPTASDVVENVGFTIDAARYGNIGRFVNHSCSPNLYAQNVVYDHEDKRIPHVMLFAAENIPPLEELTYHYNYTIDQVFDSEGNIKKKSCYCGSVECTGRLY